MSGMVHISEAVAEVLEELLARVETCPSHREAAVAKEEEADV
jgi:hypothetical protein